MIKIDRSGALAPEALIRGGAAELARLRGIVPNRRLKSTDFDRGLYSSEEIKTALWRMQHLKCCYCEREYERKYSDVEHFRPKAEAIRHDGSIDWGYWWLAYRFDNLYFACPPCNRTKSSRFPLAQGSRALVPEEDPRSTEEWPLLLDPGTDDVEAHLTFIWIPARGYQIAPLNGSKRGQWTIRVLGLDRDDLFELRAAYYRRCLEPLLRRFGEAQRAGDGNLLSSLDAEALTFVAPSAPFSLMARVALREAGLLAS